MIIGKITGKRGFWDTLRKVIAVKNAKIAVCLLEIKEKYLYGEFCNESAIF